MITRGNAAQESATLAQPAGKTWSKARVAWRLLRESRDSAKPNLALTPVKLDDLREILAGKTWKDMGIAG